MIQFLKDKPENIIGISLSGRLTKNDYDSISKVIEGHKENGKLRIYLEVLDLEGVTPEAFFKDIQISFQYYSNIHKMVITGRDEWLEGLAKIGDLLSPGIKVKFFKLDDKREAMDWLT